MDDKDGKGTYVRDTRYLNARITADGRDGWPVEPGRYRLAVARACEERVDFMAVCGLNKPGFHAISEFRRRHLTALQDLFGAVAPGPWMSHSLAA